MSAADPTDAKTKALLQALKAKLGAQRFAALIEILDEDGPEALLEAMAARTQPQATKPTKAPDFADRIQAQFSPLLARADEKAGLLIDALGASGHDVSAITPKGWRPTIVRLAVRFGEDAVQRAADRVMDDARRFGALRETVV